MFVPAFVVRAALEEQAKIAQDTRFSHSTRTHLMAELQMLGDAFEASGRMRYQTSSSAPIYSLRVPEVFQAMETSQKGLSAVEGKVTQFALWG